MSLLDTPKKIRKTIMKAKTDSGCEYRPDHAGPGVVNLLSVLSAVTGELMDSIAARYEGQGYGYLKKEVAESVTAELEPVQAEYHRLMEDASYLDGILEQSTSKVRTIAQATMARVRSAVGID